MPSLRKSKKLNKFTANSVYALSTHLVLHYPYHQVQIRLLSGNSEE